MLEIATLQCMRNATASTLKRLKWACLGM